MKKCLAVLLGLCCVMGFAGCGNSQKSGSGENKAVKTEVSTSENGGVEEKQYAPIDLFDGNIYGGMPEADGVAYLDSVPELMFVKKTGETVIHHYYHAENWLGMGYTRIDLQSYEGIVESVEYLFREASSQEVLEAMKNIYGDDCEEQISGSYASYIWKFSDAQAAVTFRVDEEDYQPYFSIGYKLQ